LPIGTSLFLADVASVQIFDFPACEPSTLIGKKAISVQQADLEAARSDLDQQRSAGQ
jgi:hypothetical protein